MPIYNDKEFIRAVDMITKEDLIETFDEIENLYKTLPIVGEYVDKKIVWGPPTPNSKNLAQLTILKAHNKEAYEYLLNHTDKEAVSSLLQHFENGLRGSTLETLTRAQIRQIEGVGTIRTQEIPMDLRHRAYSCLEHYVDSSDDFIKNTEEVETLNKYLSAFNVNENFTAFRGNKDTGMFNSIVLDKDLANKTKWIVLKNMFKARKVKVHDFTGKFETIYAQKTNLFNYIMNKKTLTLADAMQIAKYGDDSYRKQIVELIKKSQIEDTKFKSITFDKNMAGDWITECNTSNTGIFENITVKKGCQGKYLCNDNMQVEFILNNNPKKITFDDVVYDPERDIFEIKSVYECS